MPGPDRFQQLPFQRRLGAHPCPDGRGTEVRVWAPRAEFVEVRHGDADDPLRYVGFGVHEATISSLEPGDDYELVLDGTAWPDPASRWQPHGMRGPSRVLDTSFAWTDVDFRPKPLHDLVIYELHVGTFTEQGTFDAAIERLDALADLGVTAVELMPVADGPGMRGWGYDGVYLSAAHRAYGGPHGLARLVDAAHAAGLAVILDVVYNHVGASGNAALDAFGPYFTEKWSTFWGNGVNYDDAGADGVREWVLQSAVGWIEDFHVDGLRLDAIHAIYDTSARHILAELTERVHSAREGAIVIAESGLNDPKVVEPVTANGWGCDAVWADDLHHALRALLTGDRDGYYADYGAVADVAKALARPVVHDGTYSGFRDRVFGAPHDHIAPERFVVFCQDHDQVGNRAFGERLPADVQPLAAFCVLLSPFTPMLWMGEEYGEQSPFQFFTDHIDEEIAIATREGRRQEFASFGGFSSEDVPDPQDVATFERSKLTRRELPGMRDLYRRLLELRSELRAAGAGHPPEAGRSQAEIESIAYDEDGRWLRLRRAGVELVCNFSREPRELPLGSANSEVVLAAGGETVLRADAVALGPLSGAVLR